MRYKIEILSPLHVGNGTKISPMEYIVDKKFHRIDMESLFKDNNFDVEGFIENAKFNSFYLGEFYREIAKNHIMYSADISKDAENYLKEKKYRNEITEFIKSAGKPYIPGSSIKGAIRTAMMWYILKENQDLYLEMEDYLNKIVSKIIRKDRKYADDEIEKIVFGKDPTCDMMKAFHISDTNIMSPDNLKVEEIKIFTTKIVGHGYKNFNILLEALKNGTNSYIDIKIDDFLVKSKNAKELGFDNKTEYLNSFGEICNEFSKEIIKYEIDFFTKYNDGTLNYLIDFYKNLYDKNEKEILLRISWGSGWHGMTIGGELIEEEIIDELRITYGMGKIIHVGCGGKILEDRRNKGKLFCMRCKRGGLSREDIEIVKPYPKTRKIVFEDGKPKYPMGWIKLEEIK